jgi:putative ABC transport system substrate-binding protein
MSERSHSPARSATGLFIALTIGLACEPAVCKAQPTEKKIARVAALAPGPLTAQRQRNFDAFREGLRERGWIEGKNVAVRYHHAEDRGERLPEVAASLVSQRVDVIVAFGGNSTIAAAQQATRTIPIVIHATGLDPVKSGFVRSLARPGGNITGSIYPGAELGAKRLEILKQVAPAVSRVAVLINPVAFSASDLSLLQAAAKTLGIQLQVLEVRAPEAIETSFVAMRREGVNGLLVMGDARILERHLREITALAQSNRLPAIYPWRTYIDLAEGLVSYAPNLAGMATRAAYFVDRILKGAKPAELPVEQPDKFELVINLKTAKALGLNISEKLRFQADELVQ